MGNQFTKLCSHPIRGELFLTGINEEVLAVQSLLKTQVIFTLFDLAKGEFTNEYLNEKITPWHSLVAILDSHLILQHFDNKKNPDLVSFWALDVTNGNLTETTKPSSFAPINTPHWIPETTNEFDTIKQFIGENAVLGAEYLETNTTAVMAYYFSKNESFTRHLTVLKNGSTQMEILQDSNLNGFAPGSFFTTENRLIFAREKNEINIYEI